MVTHHPVLQHTRNVVSQLTYQYGTQRTVFSVTSVLMYVHTQLSVQ